ncbi:hypothetical protein Efla_003699 [Eimeria flavescens]
MSAASASPSPAAAGKARGGSSSNSMKTPIGGEDVCALVVQVGGCSVRVGYAQEDHPRIHASALVGRRRLRVPPENSGKTFCGACCCCDSQAAAAAPPDVIGDVSSSGSSSELPHQRQQSQQQPRWSKASGVSPSVFHCKGPFAWPSEGQGCCGCNCAQHDLLFPVNLGVAWPHTEVTPILSVDDSAAKAAGAASEDSKQQQQQRPLWQLDREAFSRAARICIEGHVPSHEAHRRTIRPPKQQEHLQRARGMKQEDGCCKCCCAKEQEQLSLRGGGEGPLETEGKGEALKQQPFEGGDSSLFEAFGCSPFGGLGVWTHEHPILVVEPTLASPSLREALAAAVFEDLQVPAAFFASAAATAAFAMGRSTALVVELGSAGGSVAAVCDGYTLRRGIQRFPVGGNFLDRQIELVLLQQLQQQQQQQTERLVLPLFTASRRRQLKKPDSSGASSSSSSLNCSNSLLHRSTAELLRQAREACCVVRSYGEGSLSLSGQQQNKGAKSGGGADTPEDASAPMSYELPDGTPIDCVGIRYAVGELLFQPKAALEALQAIQPAALRQHPEELLQGFAGLPSAVADCVYASDVDVRRDLLSAVILTGGLSLTPGLPDRFSDELHSEAFGPCSNNSGLKVRVVCPSSHTERRSAAWLGGSILASLGTFQELWISKQEYDEYGSTILEKRAF